MIPLCEAHDDRFHLGVAYANRSWLWSVQGETERCNEDLRTVIQLAREIGQAQVERIATYNLGEALLWQGSLDEALQLARRSEALQLGHGEGAAKLDQLRSPVCSRREAIRPISRRFCRSCRRRH